MALDRYRYGKLCDGQRAELRGNVRIPRRVVQRVGKGIVSFRCVGNVRHTRIAFSGGSDGDLVARGQRKLAVLAGGNRLFAVLHRVLLQLMGLAVVGPGLAAGGDDDGRIISGDGQFAGGKGLRLIVSGDIFIGGVFDGESVLIKRAGVGVLIGALGRRVGDGQDIARAQALDLVILGFDGLAGAGHGLDKSTAFQRGAGVLLLDVFDRYLQRTAGDLQGAKGRGNLVVTGFGFAPNDLIAVLAAAHRGLAARHVEGDGITGAEGDGAGPGRGRRGPLAADVRRPVAVIQRRSIFFGERRAVVGLRSVRRRDGQRQRLDLQDAVTGKERDGVVGIRHHRLPIDGHAGNRRFLLGAGVCIGPRVLLGDQRAVGAVQGVPDGVAVLLLEESPLAAGDADVSGFAGVFIKVLLAGIGETDVEGLAGVVVRSFSTGMRGPLVGADADVNADRLYRQGSGDIDDAVVHFRIRDRLGALGDLGVLRRGRAGAGVGLRSFEFDGRQSIAAHIAGDGIIRRIGKAAGQGRAVIGLGLVVGQDDQLFLIVDVDVQVALVAGDLIGRLRRVGRAGQIGMVIHKAIRGFVLHGIGVALLDIRGIGILDHVAVHVEIVDGDLDGGEADVLEGDDVVLQRELQLLRGLRGLIVHAEDIGIVGLGRQIGRIHVHGHFHRVGGGAGNGHRLGLMDHDFRMILQDIVHRIGDLIGDRIVVEGDHIIFIVEGKLDRVGSLVRNIPGDGRRVLGDFLVFPELGVGNRFVRQDLGSRALFVIVHHVADGLLRPVGVEGDVLRYRLVPVVGRTGLIRRGEPALEGIVLPCGIRGRGGVEAVLVRLRLDRRTALGIVGHRAGRELEIAVERQAGRHLGRAGIGIRVLMLRIREPAQPGGPLHGRFRHVAGQIASNISVQRDLLRAELPTVIVIEGQRILRSIVIEVNCQVFVGSCSAQSVVMSSTLIIHISGGVPILIGVL